MWFLVKTFKYSMSYKLVSGLICMHILASNNLSIYFCENQTLANH